MNVKQMRQNLEILLGYYNYTKDGSNLYTREPNTNAPGFYYQSGTVVCPAIFTQGSQRVPSNWNPSGLETILEENPKIRQRNLVGGGIMRQQVWSVTMRQFTPGETVTEHQLKVQRHFGEACETIRAQRKDEELFDRVMLHIITEDFDLTNYPFGAEAENVPSPIENSPVPSFFDQ